MLSRLSKVAGKGVKRDTGEDPFDMDKAIAELLAVLIPIYWMHMNEAGNLAMYMVAPTAQFDMDSPAIVAFLKERPRRVSKDINEETDKQLRATLAEGINAGESIEELSARVERVYGSAAGYRAERIARTEARRTTTQAEVTAWDQSEVVASKEWYTAQDERVCPFCGPMDHQLLGLYEVFFDKGSVFTGTDGSKIKLDYEDVMGPPLHPNCRCDLLPVLIDP